MTATVDLEAARLALRRHYPYLADILAAVVPVRRVVIIGGRATLGVDQWWRLYWSPEALTAFFLEGGWPTVAADMAHECSHLLRRHSRRLRRYPAQVANVGGDAEINQRLRRRIQAWAIQPESIGCPEGWTAEEYCEHLMHQQVTDNSGDGEPDKSGADDSAGADAPAAAGQGTPGCCGGGSGATGYTAHWEEPPPGEDGAAEGVSEAAQERVIRAVAKAIAAHAAQHGRGSVPADLLVWAEAELAAAEAARQAPTWQRLLGAFVRGVIRRGADDFGARIRAAATMSRGVVCPRRERRTPTLAVVADTSGSMSSDGSTVAATVEAICRAVGAVRVVYVDAAVAGTATATGGRDVLRAARGGGGTDLRVAIRDAARGADVVVAITDCDTPWDATPPRGGRVIVARTRRDGDVPGWVRHVIDVGGAR